MSRIAPECAARHGRARNGRGKDQSELGKPDLVEVTGLIGETPHPRLDSITRLAASVIGAPIALASVIQPDQDRQVFASSHGLPDDLRIGREIPLNMSICRHVRNAPLVIPDLLEDPRTATNPLVLERGLRAYLGVPISSISDGRMGVLCCLRTELWDWSPHEITVMQQLAACVDDLIALGQARRTAEDTGRKLQKIADTRSGFASHVGHEIRTPLTGMIGAIRLLHHMQLGGKAGDLVDLLDRNARKLLDVVDDALDLTRLESGDYSLTLCPFDLAQLARKVINMQRAAARRKSLKLSLHNHLTQPRFIGDMRLIASVLDSLFDNAVKFTQTGSATITLSSDTQGRVVIDVADTGIGIAPNLQAALFDAFEQAGPTEARKHGGTGLGMAMIRRMVDLMDGEIDVTSTPGQGARFRVSLPLTAAPALT